MVRSGRGRVARVPLVISNCFATVVSVGMLLVGFQNIACSRTPKAQQPEHQAMSRPDIKDVLRTHDEELLAIPGVVGVYVGLLDDEKTSCLKVMVVKKTPELGQKIPRSLGGYPVVIEETGVIRPMPK